MSFRTHSAALRACPEPAEGAGFDAESKIRNKSGFLFSQE